MAEFDEWEIQNFSCWSGDIHSEYLTGTHGIRLYPRGIGGKGDHLVVSMNALTKSDVPSELSFIGSDRLVIGTRRPDAESDFTGPKLEEVVAQIRGNEPMHEDQLILRWKTPQGLFPLRMRTELDAYSAVFLIKPKEFDLDVQTDLGTTNRNTICNLGFLARDEQEHTIIRISAYKTGSTLKDSKVNFKLESNAKEKIFARTSIWMLNGDNIMQKHVNDCILLKDNVHILPYEVLLKELQGLQTIMRFKIIPYKSVDNFHYYTDFPLSSDNRITGFARFGKIKSVTALRNDLTCLYQDHNISDFELRCKNVSFPTHRVILSARSPVLKAMLSAKMRESVSGHMDIEDLDPHTLGQFLAFLYSGTSGEDLEGEGALRLYYAADKYLVPSLKEECVLLLSTSVSLKNVCDILSLADKHQDEKLRSIAHDFILENYNEVLGSENWEKFMLSNSLLAVKTVTHFAKNKYVGQLQNASK